MVLGIIAGAVFLYVLCGLRIVEQTERGLKTRLGKYVGFATPGLTWVIPGIEGIERIDITENMVDAEPQEIITKDNLNAIVDAQVYFKIRSDEESVKSSQYNVSDVETQMVSLARTTLRNIIGTMSLKEANSERNKINGQLQGDLVAETQKWGIDIVRAELKEIQPPKDVQETMNQVVKAQNAKDAAVDFSMAKETEADGARRAEIKKAEGFKQARILEAEGKAQAIKIENEAANEFFKGNAQTLKKLEVLENTLKNNTKIIVPAGQPLLNVLGNLSGE